MTLEKLSVFGNLTKEEQLAKKTAYNNLSATAKFFIYLLFLLLIVAIGVGVYMSMFVAPLLINALIGFAISQSLAILTAIITCVAIVSLATWFCSLLGTSLGLGVALLSNKMNPSKTEELEKTITPVKAETILKLIFLEHLHTLANDYPETPSSAASPSLII